MSDGPIYLSAAFGDKIGYGHLARLAVLGRELMRRGESVVWWLPVDSFALGKSVILRRRLDEIDPSFRAAVENGDLHSVNLDYAVVDPAPYECRQKVFNRRDHHALAHERRRITHARHRVRRCRNIEVAEVRSSKYKSGKCRRGREPDRDLVASVQSNAGDLHGSSQRRLPMEFCHLSPCCLGREF